MPFNACTVTIQGSINWCLAFVFQRLLTGVAGVTGEPAITSANVIMGMILGPPFKWEWNRSSALSAITTKAGQSDYSVSLPTFGYLEKATLVNPAAPGPLAAQTGSWPNPPNFELEVYKVLAKDGQWSRPLKIATLLDDDAGNITFRLFPVPDKVYTVDLIYQNAPNFIPQNANLATTTWAPIPDKMSYLYQRGLLAQFQGIYNSQLYLAGMSLFIRQLVAATEGLSEAEKAIYLEDSLRAIQTQAAETLGIQQGKAARQ